MKKNIYSNPIVFSLIAATFNHLSYFCFLPTIFTVLFGIIFMFCYIYMLESYQGKKLWYGVACFSIISASILSYWLFYAVLYTTGNVFYTILTYMGFTIIYGFCHILLAVFYLTTKRLFKQKYPYLSVIVANCVSWLLFEYLLNIIGFPWHIKALLWNNDLYMLQWLFFTGKYGVCIITVAVITLPYIMFQYIYRNKNNIFKSIAQLTCIFGVLIFLLHIPGYFRVISVTSKIYDLKIRLVDPYWSVNPNDSEYHAYNLNEIFSLSVKQKLDGVDMIIWPETIVTMMNKELPSNLSNLIKPLEDTKLITGALRFENNKAYNSLIVTNNKSSVIALYDKHKLVPFGEYIPILSIFNSDMQWVAQGRSEHVFKIDKYKYLFSICYETIYNIPNYQHNIIVNVSNDAWYNSDLEKYQHMALSKISSIVSNSALIRVSNMGISGVINQYGKIIASMGPMKNSNYIDIML